MLIKSLKLRVLAASSFALLICMSLMGIAVVQSFESTLFESVETELKADTSVILAAARVKDGKLAMPEVLPHDEFNEIDSTVFGHIYDQNNHRVWRSLSALDERLNFNPEKSEKETEFQLISAADNDYFYYRVNLHLKKGNYEIPISIVTFKPATHFYQVRKSFNQAMLFWQLLAITGSLLALFLAMRWTLTPLAQIAAHLHNVETGKQSFLANDYPKEINRLAKALNTLLESEANQRERYKNAMADLAHSLKTPLAVIHSTKMSASIKDGNISLNELHELDQIVDEQVQQMNQIVSYQLQRAVIRHQALIKKQISVNDIAKRIGQTLEKVYRDKEVSFTLVVNAESNFIGEEQDLMEVLGNLLENAFRLCLFQVRLSCNSMPAPPEADTGLIELIVEDDGPGIDRNKRSQVLERGVRADTFSPGQGIGLAITMDIVDSYGGQLQIDSSTLGGALFRVSLPGSNRN